MNIMFFLCNILFCIHVNIIIIIDQLLLIYCNRIDGLQGIYCVIVNFPLSVKASLWHHHPASAVSYSYRVCFAQTAKLKDSH